ncbi:MAG: hypothetical protein PHW53_01590 [Patescibacteria group bacterium]|nr:hypothetical protein [Patescibacteria group bacterium]
MKKMFIMGCIALLMAMTLASGAQAIGILPFIVEDVNIAPGEMATRTFTVYNNTESEQTYYFVTRNFTTRGEEGEVVITEEKFGLATWIEFPFTSITIPSSENREIEFTIIIPPNADAGGHFAAVFASTNPPDVEQGVGLSANVGTLVFVRVSGDIIDDVRLLSFHTKGDQALFSHLPVNFEYRIENRGTVHAKPTGRIMMSGWLGKTDIDANPKENRILPSSIRRIEATWVKDSGAIRSGGFLTELKNEWNNFAIGKYTAALDLSYGVEGKNLTTETAFWVFPWHVCLAALLILIGTIVAIILYNKMVIATARKSGKL